MVNTDRLTITILADGTIKVETDSISEGNHLSAEQFLRTVHHLMGGPETVEQKEAHAHHHQGALADSW